MFFSASSCHVISFNDTSCTTLNERWPSSITWTYEGAHACSTDFPVSDLGALLVHNLACSYSIVFIFNFNFLCFIMLMGNMSNWCHNVVVEAPLEHATCLWFSCYCDAAVTDNLSFQKKTEKCIIKAFMSWESFNAGTAFL